MKIPAKTLTLLVERSVGRCELYGAIANSTHHRKPRRMGGSRCAQVNSVPNLLRLCGDGTRGCHGYIESHRAWAYDQGLLIHQNANPAEVPVLLRVGWVFLTSSGLYLPVQRGAA